MPRAADALQECCDGARRAELADEIDLTDVDAELEGCRGNEGSEFAALEALFRVETLFLGEAAVVRSDLVVPEAFGNVPRHAFDHPTCIGKDQRRAMCPDQLGQTVIDLLPDLGRHHGFERRGRHLDCKIARAAVTQINNAAATGQIIIASRIIAMRTQQQARHGVDGFLCCRKSDAQRRARTKCATVAPATGSIVNRACSPRARGISSIMTVRVVFNMARPDAEPSST